VTQDGWSAAELVFEIIQANTKSKTVVIKGEKIKKGTFRNLTEFMEPPLSCFNAIYLAIKKKACKNKPSSFMHN
jgi:hypothetical protein